MENIIHSKESLFQLPQTVPLPPMPEIFEPLVKGRQILIERIVSVGQQTPPDYWYEQETDEWVVLLTGQATLLFDHEQGQTLVLNPGDWVFIRAMRRHRVIYTSSAPPCIWLAIHGNF